MRNPNEGVSIAALVTEEMMSDYARVCVVGFCPNGIGFLARDVVTNFDRRPWEQRRTDWGYWFFSTRRLEREKHRYNKAQEIFTALEKIYYRLRFVEDDHVVFDPLTGKEAPATRTHIVKLWEDLASQDVSDFKSPLSDLSQWRKFLDGWALKQMEDKAILKY